MPRRQTLLLVDGVINLVLGVLLISFPDWLVAALGIPPAEPAFYPNLLGAVLTGIGIALLAERFRPASRSPGLGLIGAVAINLCAATALAGWLVFGELVLPLRGSLFLWGIVALVMCLGIVEILREVRTDENGRSGFEEV